MIFFTTDKKHLAWRYKFLRKNSGKEHKTILRCAVPYGAMFVRLGFRVNIQVATPSNTKINIPKIEEWVCNVTDNIEESYDDVHDYEKRYESVDLDKEPWLAVGGFENQFRSTSTGKDKLVPGRLTLLKLFGLKPNFTVLDVGCGTGASIHSLKPYLDSPKNYVGTDLVQKAVDYCKQKFPEWEFHKNEPSKLPNLNRKFDMIILFSVFTHLQPYEIKSMLLELKNFLKDDGSIVASVSINPFIKSKFIGTRGSIEMNKKVFFETVNSAGFSKINSCIGREIGIQSMYQIWI